MIESNLCIFNQYKIANTDSPHCIVGKPADLNIPEPDPEVVLLNDPVKDIAKAAIAALGSVHDPTETKEKKKDFDKRIRNGGAF